MYSYTRTLMTAKLCNIKIKNLILIFRNTGLFKLFPKTENWFCFLKIMATMLEIGFASQHYDYAPGLHFQKKKLYFDIAKESFKNYR